MKPNQIGILEDLAHNKRPVGIEESATEHELSLWELGQGLGQCCTGSCQSNSLVDMHHQ